MQQVPTLLVLAGLAVAERDHTRECKRQVDPDAENWLLAKSLLWTWSGIMGVLMAYALYQKTVRTIRTIACLQNNTQRYFQRSQSFYAFALIQRYLLAAPLSSKRHHREFRLSSAINLGTLPSRTQTLFLLGYLAATITLTMFSIDLDAPSKEVLSNVLDRTGILAVTNMVPLFLLAGRNNPLIKLTSISFDTYNLIHRWLGRIVVLEAVAHGLCWIISKKVKRGWKAIEFAESHSTHILTGTIAACAFVAILFSSPSAIRHAFYEVFLAGHILLVMLSVGALWIHLKEDQQIKNLLIGAIAIWAFERTVRMIRLLYHNVGPASTYAEVEALPGDAVRVSATIARPWTSQPGQHAYIYIPAIGLWTSHPFTVAWSEDDNRKYADEANIVTPDLEKGTQSITGKMRVSFIIRRRTGFTDTLYKKAQKSVSGRVTARAFVEGPYGQQSLRSYGTVLLFAAGVGITHQVPHLLDLITGFNDGTVATRRIVLVWAIQDSEHMEWVRPWMMHILNLPGRRDILRIMLYVTQSRSSQQVTSPSTSVQMFAGRPNVRRVIDEEVQQSIGAVGVCVCGVGGLADDVRAACRSWMGKVKIDFFEESFSW